MIEVIIFFAVVLAIITAIGIAFLKDVCDDRSVDMDRLLVELKSQYSTGTNLNNNSIVGGQIPDYSQYNDMVAEYNKDCTDYRDFIQQTKTQ